MDRTLLTVCPLATVLLPSPPKEATKGLTLRDAVHHVFRLLSCAVLQVLWCCRALLLPVYAGVGTASIFASSKNAQDIVLNSVRARAPQAQPHYHSTLRLLSAYCGAGCYRLRL